LFNELKQDCKISQYFCVFFHTLAPKARKTRFFFALRVRQDLPDEISIIGEKEFTSPKGNKCRIILTDEKDLYDKKANASKKGNQEKTE